MTPNNFNTDILVPSVRSLENGLRLVHIHDPYSRVGIFGVCVRVGSADEKEGEFGLAHFVEHTIFKGTQQRSSIDILNCMEAVGGELNAYTTSEATVVYSIFPAEYLERATDVIADLVMNSQFPHAELVKEKQVVLDEINSYLDSPSEAIFDSFEDFMFAGCGYGHNILGTPKSVRSFNSSACRGFLDRYYRAGNMVAFYCGPATSDNCADLVLQYFRDLNSEAVDAERTTLNCTPGFHRHKYLPVHQAHVLLGACVSTPTPRQRYAAALFANILGGPGMNSLLNVQLRENRGLVYSVEASATFLAAGQCLLTVYFGCDADDRKECIDICNDVLMQLSDGSALSDEEFAQALTQFLGQRTIAVENRESRIIASARSTLFYGEPEPDQLVRQGIASLVKNDVAAVAADFISYSSSLLFLPKK